MVNSVERLYLSTKMFFGKFNFNQINHIKVIEKTISVNFGSRTNTNYRVIKQLYPRESYRHFLHKLVT